MNAVAPRAAKAAHAAEAAAEAAAAATHKAADRMRDKMNEVKPNLRGWFHAASAPLALAAGIVLIVLSPTPLTRVGSAVFTGTLVALLSTSAIYHRGNWSIRTWAILRRLDHSNIYLLIAGTYTPFALVLLDGWARIGLLIIAWGGALAGVLMHNLWRGAPRWLSVPVYIGLGWVAVFYAFEWQFPSVSVAVLLAAGGLLYTLGGVVYAFKWPNPNPRWFGFHEIFHAFTVGAIVCHYIAVSLMTYELR